MNVLAAKLNRPSAISLRPPSSLAAVGDRLVSDSLASAHPEVNLLPKPTALVQPYYDSHADAQLKAAYYGSIKLEGKDPTAAFRELSQLVEQTHTEKLNYNPSKYVYPWVDVRPNGQLESIYSPLSIRLVEMSPAKQQALDQAAAQMASLSALAPEAAACQIGLTQSLGALNCEHVVPQSWYSKEEPMRGDLHHLFACDSRCNSSRGNRAYREPRVGSIDEVENCGMITDGGKGFRPLAGRGAVARATLYFLVRYPQRAIAYGPEDVKTLLKWHQAEPPTLHEKHRNVAIQELQGNRNPFIDNPHWASLVDFSAGLAERPVEVPLQPS